MEIDKRDYHVHKSPEDQKNELWRSLVTHSRCSATAGVSSRSSGGPNQNGSQREWPTYDAVIAHVTTQDYKKNLVCPHDIMKDKAKTICPHGVICCAKMELFPNNNDHNTMPYTGLFSPGTTVEHCMIRLSSAIRPLDQGVESDFARIMVRNAVSKKLSKAKIVPGVALKAFRDNNIPSGNLLFLGSKVGQREEDFFAHCVCTTMTEKMPQVALPFVKKFFRYSKFPLSLGVSDFCGHDQHGDDQRGQGHNFPFAVTLKPVLERPPDATEATSTTTTSTATTSNSDKQQKQKRKNFATFDSFIDEVTTIPPGTALYDIYASPDPESVGDPTRIQRIGRIVTTSEFIPSAPTDGIFFRHQVKEEDFQLRPQWKEGIARKMAMDGGKTKGTVGKLAGWRLFEEDIALGKYADFEKP